MRQKLLRKMHFKNMKVTYKSQILKSEIQQKVLNIKDVISYISLDLQHQ